MTTKPMLETWPEGFVHLHLHSQYSLLDGAIRLGELVDRAAELGMPALAQTDHGNMFGAIDFYSRCTSRGIKPILGSEIYFTPGSRSGQPWEGEAGRVAGQDGEEAVRRIHHLILLCKDATGFGNLCRLLSQAYLEGFYYKPRADMALLEQYAEGLICTSACLKGEVAYNFSLGRDAGAEAAIDGLHRLFGDDFYLEIQEDGIDGRREVNEKIIDCARRRKVNLVATNDCHYMSPEDAEAREVLLCIQMGRTLDEGSIRTLPPELYFKTPGQMREAFHYCPEACDNTLKIADKCNLELKWTDGKGDQVYHLPDFPIETGESSDEYFERIAVEGLRERFGGPHFVGLRKDEKWEGGIKLKYEARLRYEMDMIRRMGFSGYFLVVSDFIKWSKDNSIPVGPGRGSGAGSLVAYALNITNIDPLPYNLLFERFINPERISMPDFDVDFCQNGRARVIDYVTKKYGEDKVGQIITFGKLQAKAAIKDVSRVFGLSFTEADALSKLIPEELGMTLDKAFDREPRLEELTESDPKVRRIFSIARKVEGLYRHAGIHAAGVVITNKPLVEYCPLFKGAKGEKVIQFDKDFAEKIGLIKFDFLGLKTLTAIDYATKFIRRRKDGDFDIESISYEDNEVFKFIGQGHTVGIFQLESSGMVELCKRIKPDSIDDITAINALYRPGPMGSGMHEEFVEIKHGRKPESYIFEELRPLLRDTYGIIVYQEQVMHIAQKIAGYTLGQADMLRKAMGKKKIDEMKRHREIFLAGAEKNGLDLEKAATLYDMMAKFAEYGFNKSHAVAYSYISYQTAFLKYYYRIEFFAALLSTEMTNTDKVTAYIQDAKSYGIAILPPDINESIWLFDVVGEKIRFGMGAVKNVGEGVVQEIVEKRKQGGAFLGIVDFCERVDTKALNKKTLESLVRVGAFDACEEKLNRKTMIGSMERIVSYGLKRQSERLLGQSNLFDLGGSSNGPGTQLDILEATEYSDREKLGFEASLLGIYVSGHPLDRFMGIVRQMTRFSLNEIHRKVGGDDRREVTVVGIVSNLRKITTKKGGRMCFAVLEDVTGRIECIVFPKIFVDYEELLASGDPLVVKGRINWSESPRKLIPNGIRRLEDVVDERVTGVKIRVKMEELSEIRLDHLKRFFMDCKGKVPLWLFFQNEDGEARLSLSKDFCVDPVAVLSRNTDGLFQGYDAMEFVVGRPGGEEGVVGLS